MTLFNGMNKRQRIDFLEEVETRANRELSVVSLQVLAVIASRDSVSLPRIRRRSSALLVAINSAQEELEVLHEEEGAGDREEGR